MQEATTKAKVAKIIAMTMYRVLFFDKNENDSFL